MVRLRPIFSNNEVVVAKAKFQSHYGAIATPPDTSIELSIELFQSHYGAIATHHKGLDYVVVEVPFQSHYGAIATEASAPVWKPNTWFQSHYGAIATHLATGSAGGGTDRVLIPLWCNCDTTVKRLPTKIPLFQSHYGAIATVRSGFP